MHGPPNTAGPTGPACARCGATGERLAELSGAAPMCIACRTHVSAVRARHQHGNTSSDRLGRKLRRIRPGKKRR
jgi:hypothetical protein